MLTISHWTGNVLDKVNEYMYDPSDRNQLKVKQISFFEQRKKYNIVTGITYLTR